jgi:integrase
VAQTTVKDWSYHADEMSFGPLRFTTLGADRAPRRLQRRPRLAIYTGMRRGELLGLTWDAIDFDNRVPHVRQSLEVIGAGKDRAVRFKAQRPRRADATSR